MFTEWRASKLAKWPKQLPPLSVEQLRTRDEFIKLWHEILPKRYGAIENFNQRYPVSRMAMWEERPNTLEIGAGLGGHLDYEDLEHQEYYALELRPAMAEKLGERFPQCHAVVGDCQSRLLFDDGFFHRVLAIHVLEHLPNLPAALREVHRVLRADGQFVVVIPCD
jgi:SAM-dependent methyltransferase